MKNDYISEQFVSTQRSVIISLLKKGKVLTNAYIQQELKISGSTARLSEIKDSGFPIIVEKKRKPNGRFIKTYRIDRAVKL